MISECFRILRPHGRLRVATPDLSTFIGLYGQQRTLEQQKFLDEYIRLNSGVWSADLLNVQDNHAVFAINHAFHAWGHKFLYDYQTLHELLASVGFEAVSREEPSKSADPNLRNLERRDTLVGTFDALIVEARKPE
jgi:predicted SAM-dependent methyltransferase